MCSPQTRAQSGIGSILTSNMLQGCLEPAVSRIACLALAAAKPLPHTPATSQLQLFVCLCCLLLPLLLQLLCCSI